MVFFQTHQSIKTRDLKRRTCVHLNFKSKLKERTTEDVLQFSIVRRGGQVACLMFVLFLSLYILCIIMLLVLIVYKKTPPHHLQLIRPSSNVEPGPAPGGGRHLGSYFRQNLSPLSSSAQLSNKIFSG